MEVFSATERLLAANMLLAVLHTNVLGREAIVDVFGARWDLAESLGTRLRKQRTVDGLVRIELSIEDKAVLVTGLDALLSEAIIPEGVFHPRLGAWPSDVRALRDRLATPTDSRP